MCDFLERLKMNQSIQIKRWPSQLQIEKHTDGVGQHFTNQTVLEVPQVMHPNARYGKALGEVRTNRFHLLAPAGTRFEQGWLMGRGGFHIAALRRDNVHIGAHLQQSLSKGPKGSRKPLSAGAQPLNRLPSNSSSSVAMCGARHGDAPLRADSG